MIDQIISNHSLFIDEEYEFFINNFCSTTGQNFPQGKMGNYLGSWYEGYLFCLMIGLNSNNRHQDGFIKRHTKMSNWSTQNIDQYKYCIARVISRKDIILELKLKSREDIKTGFKNIEELLSSLKIICDQFSLGGLLYIKNLYEIDSTIFEDPFALKSIYENSLEVTT